MDNLFPSQGWLDGFFNYINNDQRYADIAKNWEGDIIFFIEPSGNLKKVFIFFIGLWHGKCTGVKMLENVGDEKATFTLTSSYENIIKILKGELDPIQAMLTRKLKVQGNLAVMMKNIPTVLDFVRCAREATDEVI